MREIKFRGKRIDNGQWVYGYLVKQFGVFKIYDDSSEDFGDWIHEVNPETIGQFTGLKGKDYNEIYEGDIIQGRDKDGPSVIKFGGFTPDVLQNWSTRYWNKFLPKMLGFYGEVINGENKGQEVFIPTTDIGFTVIGNMYENKELLEESKC